MTLAGTTALRLSEERFTIEPLPEAATLKVTVPVEKFPPLTVAGDNDKPDRPRTTTLRGRENVALPCVALIVTEAVADSEGFPDMANVAEVAPAGTVTEEDTVAADVFVLDRDTTSPPEGADEERVTVPVAWVPAAIELGATVRFVNEGTMA